MNNKLKKFFYFFAYNILASFVLIIFLNSYIENNFDNENCIFSKIRNYISTKMLFSTDNNSNFDIDKNSIEEAFVKKIPVTAESISKFCGEERTEFGLSYPKNPIILLGCSYTYGHGLKKEETFPYQLSKYSKRPVFNYAFCGGQINGSYDKLQYFLSTSDEKRIQKADYIIYLYMFDHINRYLLLQNIYKNYEIYFSTSKKDKYILKFAITRYIISAIQLKKILKNYPDNQEADIILKKTILNISEKLKEISPDAKQIIIIYDEKIGKMYPNKTIVFCQNIINSKIWKELQKENDITVLHTKDLTGFLFDKDYKIKEDISDWHPNAKVWELFTPVFVSKYIK